MLITAAPRSIAVRICWADVEHGISSGSGTLSARAPGQTPTMPMPLTGAAATEAVAGGGVGAELHAHVDVLGRADALADREVGLVDELGDDPAERQPRPVGD